MIGDIGSSIEKGAIATEMHLFKEAKRNSQRDSEGEEERQRGIYSENKDKSCPKEVKVVIRSESLKVEK